MTKILLPCIAIFAIATLAPGQSTIVEWGDDGGAQDIVTGNVPLNPFPTPTYSSNSDVSPDVGATYYPNNTGRTPVFGAAASYDNGDGNLDRFLWARQIQDNVPNGDRIRLENTNQNPNGGSIFTHAMVVWDDEDWLPSSDDTLDALTVQAFRSNPEPGTTMGSGRFLVESNSGWFASDVLPLNPGFETQSAPVSTLDWFDFTPMNAGVVSVGSAASPDFTDVVSVGYYFEVSTANPSSLGAFIRYFQATATTGGGGLSCDFDGSGTCTIDDIDAMFAIGPIASGVPVMAGVNDQFDLNMDDTIDLLDRDEWLAQAATENGFGSPYKLGDATLDGIVDGLDFIEWNDSKFTTDLLWSSGNFDGDAVVDGLDFIEWNNNKFTSSDAASVPEPASGSVLMISLGLWFLASRRSR